MKHVAVTFAVISFLPCLGAGEEKAQPMASPYHQFQFTQPIAEFEAQPDPAKDGDASHSTSNVRVTPKLRRTMFPAPQRSRSCMSLLLD